MSTPFFFVEISLIPSLFSVISKYSLRTERESLEFMSPSAVKSGAIGHKIWNSRVNDIFNGNDNARVAGKIGTASRGVLKQIQ